MEYGKNFSMEWNMEENFNMEWNMEKILVWNGIWRKILVWNGIWNGRFLVWNGRKLPVWNMEKSSSIPFHALAVGGVTPKIFLVSHIDKLFGKQITTAH